MKKIITDVQRIEKVTIFEAMDGTTFSDEEVCKKYEKSLECTINAAWNKIPKGEIDFDSIFPGGYEDDSYIILKPRDYEDVKIINTYTGFSNEDLLTQDDIGKEICIENCCGEFYRCRTESIWETLIADIMKGKEKVNSDLDTYGLYEATCTVNGKNIRNESYSYIDVMNYTKYNIRSTFCSIEGFNEQDVTVTVTKDGEPFETKKFHCEYDKSVGYKSWKCEEI